MEKWIMRVVAILFVALLITSADNMGIDGQPTGADEIDGIKYQRIKLIEGADGTNGGDVCATNPLPVIDASWSIAADNITPYEAVHRIGQTDNADATATDIWYGATTTPVFVAPTVARVHNIGSADPLDMLFACTLTFTAAPTDTETITIASKVYTFQAVLTDVDGNVFIGVDAEACLDNLIDAINLGPTAGTDYAASMTANAAPTSAVAGAGDTMTLYAESAIATTDGMGADGTWSAVAAVEGTGAQTVTIWGLTSWTAAEVSETVTMTGITASPTTNSYVFINRMEVATNGGTYINKGDIKATAVTDSSVSAYIAALVGVSHSAIIGVPSVETLYVDQLLFSILAAGTTDICNFSLLVNDTPASQLTMFREHIIFGLTGTDTLSVVFDLPTAFAGPCIVKLRALSDTADSHVMGMISGVLATN
jgi:hypothetical protein